MKAIFDPFSANGTVRGIPSKSYAHRALILSHFSGGKVILSDKNDDIIATENCLKNIENGALFCGESGSTLRFLLPIVSVLGGKYEFTGAGRLLSRPLSELFSVLEEHGIKIDLSAEKISVSGKLNGGVFRIRGDISSQYVSGLLMALPLIDGGEIELLSPLSSASYVDITLNVMESFGVKVKREANGFTVPKAAYKRKEDYYVPCDWSAAAFPLSMGALSGKVSVTGLSINDLQGDRFILEILKRTGARIKVTENSVTAEKDELNGFTFDADGCPDLVPVAAAVAAAAKGETVIKRVSRLRLKESDRVLSVVSMLDSVGITARTIGDDIVIKGGAVAGGKVKTFSDHRIAMSAGVLSAASKGKIEIDDAACVNKSYPSFYKDYEKLGGTVSVR
ncbi:MAG: 3-phosphoshikimate 1-carboxyvinyltransferase [Clostridia bacterium]|nr:3-phosphoshikimate 1-carboxyvinyltransferase [Clostridia bacterium]